MAHRFNCNTDQKEPKPSARERTLFRWRVRNGIETSQDIKRQESAISVKEKIKEKLGKVKAKLVKDKN